MSESPTPQVMSVGDAFFLQYGQTLAEWAELEFVLSSWFHFVTEMNFRMAEAVFYSGRSFNSRRDMLLRAIPQSTLDEATKTFLVEAVKRASAYSAARNTIAHDLAVMCEDIDQMAIVPGDRIWSAERVTITSLKEAQQNFRSLRSLLLNGLPPGSEKQPAELYRQVCTLPKKAYASAESPMLLEP